MRFLIINPFGIGDVLFTTPVIRTLKENNSGSFIGYLCNIRTKPLLERNIYLDKVFVYEKDDFRKLWKSSKLSAIKKFFDFLKEIKKEKFDLAIDVSLGRNYSFFSYLSGIKRRIGFNYKNRGCFLTDKINLKCYEKKHVVEYYFDILGLLEEKPNSLKLDYFLNKDDIKFSEDVIKNLAIRDSDLLIGISPFGGASWGKDAKYKQMSLDKYGEVINGLIEKFNAKIIIFASPDEKESCQNLINLLKYPIINFCGKTNLGELGALIKKCRVFITNDGGPLHIAAALGVKTISIFGPVDEFVYGPYPKSKEHIVVKKDLSCRPCYKNFKMPKCLDQKCLNTITSSEIIEKVGGLL